MSDLRFVEVDPTTVQTPPAGGKTIFNSSSTHVVSVKDESGTVSPLGGAAGLSVGGVLTGTLPNPGLAATTVVSGSYGDGTHVVTLTIGVDGRITAATTVAITGAPPSGAAGGVLGGTFPSPGFGSFTSATLATALTDETGTGAAVFASAPTLTNPVVGTQTAHDNSTKAASTAYVDAAVGVVSLNYVIDGGGSAIATGVKGYLVIDFAATILQVTLLADTSTTSVVNIWKCTYAQFDAGSTHPVVGDKITSTHPPTITATVKSQDATLTSWTTSITAGDVIAFNVDSNNNATRITLALKLQRT